MAQGKRRRPGKGNTEALNALQEAQVLNPKLSLNELVDASRRLEAIVDIDELAAWTFISPNYVYTGD